MYNKKYLKELAYEFTLLKDVAEVEDFLISLLKMEELSHIPRRLQIIKLLRSGKTQREIAKKLKVSITTVTNGSLQLQMGRFKNIQ